MALLNNNLLSGNFKHMLRGAFGLFLLLSAPIADAQTHYGLFPSSEASDAMRKMKTKDETNTIRWTCDESVTKNTKIWLRNSDSELNPYNQEMLELSNLVSIPCKTPNREFRLKAKTALRDMGLSLCDTIQKLNIWLTFKPSGAPDTLFIGVKPGPNHFFDFPTPHIVSQSKRMSAMGTFPKGEALVFEAEPPIGINSDLLEWEWYLDGELMRGRSDRWYETYSRTMWKDGKHTVACRYKKKNGVRFSELGQMEIWQNSTDDRSIKAFPYWGADCTDEENLDSTQFCYNEKSKWGSFIIQPIEEYVHFYLEVLGQDITSSTITNDARIRNFELLEAHDAGRNYTFFDVPTTCKAHAKEPYSPTKVYFRIEGTNINYSLLPYVKPSVTVSPCALEICENSFESATDMSVFSAACQGLADGTYFFRWYYSNTENGEYTLVPDFTKEKFAPDHTGYYKVEATDGVFSAWSEPLPVRHRTENCISANIYSKEGKDYTCPNGSLELHTSLISPSYTYQWKIGPANGKHLRDIEGANSDMFYGSTNKPGEAYFVEVRHGSRQVRSNPFRVRQISKLTPVSTKKLITEAYPKEVCMDYNVTIKARVSGRDNRRDSLPLIYELYQTSILKPQLLSTIESTDENVYFSTPVHNTGSKYYVKAVGCDQQLRSDNGNMTVNLRNDESCGLANFYVKKTGDDFNDGTSWANAFATVNHAIQIAKDLRKSILYANTPIIIHIAAGIYSPANKEGFDFPDNTTIYGGYDELPTDHSVSGTVRNPNTPGNPTGNATIFLTDSASHRIVKIVDRENVKFVGIHFRGDKLITDIPGRAMKIDGSSVTLDSCWFSEFVASPSSPDPIAAVAFTKDDESIHNNIDRQLNIHNTTFSDNVGGEWGGCVNVYTDGVVNIKNSTFNHNTNAYKGGTAMLVYNASPKIYIENSTFYDNRITSPAGAFGSSVFRMVGGAPTINIVCSTICDHFYKENGVLNIYNSIVECAGNADNYQNNYPKVSPYAEETKDNAYNARAFATNFKGSPFNKMMTVSNCITQVLIPNNKLEIINQAGRPYTLCLYDQRGIRRNDIASTFGAYDMDYAVAIEESKPTECINQTTVASFHSSVCGLDSVTYQWVDNYSDIKDATTPELNNVGLGTYWLEVKGVDPVTGKHVNLRSSEIRISDICETPGDFFVNPVSGADTYGGATWNKAFASLDQAMFSAKNFREKHPGAHIKIHLAAGTYKPFSQNGFRLEKYAKELEGLVIEGGYPKNATKEDASQPRNSEKADGNETILTPLNNKGRLFDITGAVKGIKFKGIHFKGMPKMISNGGAFNINGSEIEIDSCWFSGFTDASVTAEGNNSTINIEGTSKLTLKSCHFSNNNARQSGGIGINGSDNKSVLYIYNTTFDNNYSNKTGGAAMLINNGANPKVTFMNCTFFGNRCMTSDFSGCSVIRSAGKDADLKFYQTTLYGTCYNEKGKMAFYNSLVEATSHTITSTNCFIADQGLSKVTDDVNITLHRKFADAFEYSLTYDCGFVPVLKMKEETQQDADLGKLVPSIENVDGFDVGTDACDMPRAAECYMGATQITE